MDTTIHVVDSLGNSYTVTGSALQALPDMVENIQTMGAFILFGVFVLAGLFVGWLLHGFFNN